MAAAGGDVRERIWGRAKQGRWQDCVTVTQHYRPHFSICISIAKAPCVVVLRIQILNQFICAQTVYGAIEPMLFSVPPSGPSNSCDGACRRGLGHAGALFGQA